MSDYKKFVVPLAAFGLAYTLCPVTEERQPHGPHHEHHPVQIPTIEYYSSASSMSGAVPFVSAIDSSDVVMAAHRARLNGWHTAMQGSVFGTPAVFTDVLKLK